MARPRAVYECTTCGDQAPRWVGRCSGCGHWNTLVESTIDDPPAPASRAAAAAVHGRAVPLAAQALLWTEVPRTELLWTELPRTELLFTDMLFTELPCTELLFTDFICEISKHAQ